MNMQVLVTGGTGFIGGWLARSLVDAGCRVTLLDMSAGPGTTAARLGLLEDPRIRLITGDVREPATFDGLGTDYHYIVHLAAVLGIRDVVQHSVRTLQVNIRGTELCLELARRQRDLRRFLMVSTSEVYGRQAGHSGETDSLSLAVDSLRWGYAASKLAGEFFTRAYASEYSVPTSIVRPFNVYGPLRGGDNAMSAFVRRALAGDCLRVSGDGSQVRSWCYISDFIDGLMACLQHDSALGETFNIGDDRQPISILELARRVVAIAGSRSRIEQTGTVEPDVQQRSPDLTKARQLLGYSPTVDIESGIERVVAAEAQPRLPLRGLR